jgi:DNA adenine methylase
MATTKPRARPFLKWAGGKTRLLGVLSELLPDEIETFYEPFLGGGSLYFHLAQQRRFRHAVLNDRNPEVVNCYRVVRDFASELVEQLSALHVSKEVFEELRGIEPTTLSPVRRAARMIYLNKTAFNGLYRVNRNGRFNVPWGDYKNPKVVDEDNLIACSHVLNGSTALLDGDFVEAVGKAAAGDVVYFDPPYVPLSPTASFKNYTKDGFTLNDQQRLAICVRELASKGVLVLVSNSDTPTVRELYEGFQIHVARMRRNISSKGDGRGPVDEVIVTTRPVQGLEDLV